MLVQIVRPTLLLFSEFHYLCLNYILSRSNDSDNLDAEGDYDHG